MWDEVGGQLSGAAQAEERRLEQLAARLGAKRRRLPWYARCNNCEWPIGCALALLLLLSGHLNDVTVVGVALVMLVIGVAWPLMQVALLGIEVEEEASGEH